MVDAGDGGRHTEVAPPRESVPAATAARLRWPTGGDGGEGAVDGSPLAVPPPARPSAATVATAAPEYRWRRRRRAKAIGGDRLRDNGHATGAPAGRRHHGGAGGVGGNGLVEASGTNSTATGTGIGGAGGSGTNGGTAATAGRASLGGRRHPSGVASGTATGGAGGTGTGTDSVGGTGGNAYVVAASGRATQLPPLAAQPPAGSAARQ